ncbi:MAG: hypothetical protein IT480_18295 [Gammaproteobacteria bacterium]|nr:hypothetical protein [Gammaproteobacteria bacterium]
MELNSAISFPVALYEGHEDVVAYLRRTRTGITLPERAEATASPDVKGTCQGLMIPRKLHAVTFKQQRRPTGVAKVLGSRFPPAIRSPD